EMSIWQSKLAVGDTAKTQLEYAKIQTAETMRQKIENKVTQLREQKNSISEFLSSLKEMISSIQSDNPMMQLFTSVVEGFIDLCENLFDVEKEKSSFMKESTSSNDHQLSSILENSEDKIQTQKDLEKTLMSQSKEKELKVNDKENTFQKDVVSKESKETPLSSKQEYIVDKIYELYQQSKIEGNDLQLDKLMSITNTGTDQDKKLIVDKSLTSIFEDLASLIGKDNTILNRRDETERRNDTDRRENQNRNDSEDRRIGERRQQDTTFLG
ncbi:MAG: hypothetical protein AB7V50_11165, partial [Vampirovibrionia bacterium]